jgi:hypothetical protein
MKAINWPYFLTSLHKRLRDIFALGYLSCYLSFFAFLPVLKFIKIKSQSVNECYLPHVLTFTEGNMNGHIGSENGSTQMIVRADILMTPRRLMMMMMIPDMSSEMIPLPASNIILPHSQVQRS